MKRPQLLIMSGPMAGKRFDVPDGGLRLGRSRSNDVHVPDEELSRNHCLFETEGMDAIRVVDLASANGTYVNSEQLGADARVLKPGDVIEAGCTVLKVVNEGEQVEISKAPEPPPPPPVEPVAKAAPGPVDLGLGAVARGADIVADATPGWGSKKSSMRINILWGIVALLVASAIALMLLIPAQEPDDTVTVSVREAAARPVVTALKYEKVDADAQHIFRFVMEVDGNGEMSVVCDDVPGENRHVKTNKKLGEEDRKKISKIFDDAEWRELGPVYTGSLSIDENRLKSWRICAIGTGGVKDVQVVNCDEPPAFRAVREKLEALSLDELSIWALQRSAGELLRMSAEKEQLGDAKWNDRDVKYGNISDAIKAYRDALQFLDTIGKKPDGYEELKKKLERANEELTRRCDDQRFLVDRATNLEDWETARRELRILLDTVTDPNDPRHTSAREKLNRIESKLSAKHKKGGK